MIEVFNGEVIAGGGGGGNDPYAVHINVGNEFYTIPQKNECSATDLLLIENADLYANRSKAKIYPSAISIDIIGEGTEYKKYTEVERLKLQTIETGADITDIENVTLALASISVAAHSDIFSPGTEIESAVLLKHQQGTDTTLGVQSLPIDMGGNRIVNGSFGVNPNDFVIMSQLDTSDSSAIHKTIPDEIAQLNDIGINFSEDDVVVIEHKTSEENPIWNKYKLSVGNLRGAYDQYAIHYNRPNEIVLTELKWEPAIDSIILIEQQNETTLEWEKFHIQLNQLYGTDINAFHRNASNEFMTVPHQDEMDIDDIFLVEHPIYLSEEEVAWEKRFYALKELLIPNIDTKASHYNVANEYYIFLTQKLFPVGEDRIVIEDSESSTDEFKKKWINLGDIPVAVTDINAIHINGIDEFSTIEEEFAPSTTDYFLLEKGEDTANPGEKRKLRIAHVPTANDPYAWHVNGLDELNPVPQKYDNLDNDFLMLQQAVDGHTRKVKIADLPTGGGGEVNTGENVGWYPPNTDPKFILEVYKEKVGSTLEFNRIYTGVECSFLQFHHFGDDPNNAISIKFNSADFATTLVTTGFSLRGIPDDDDTFDDNNRYVKITEAERKKIGDGGGNCALSYINAGAIALISGSLVLNSIWPWSGIGTRLSTVEGEIGTIATLADYALDRVSDLEDRLDADELNITFLQQNAFQARLPVPPTVGPVQHLLFNEIVGVLPVLRNMGIGVDNNFTEGDELLIDKLQIKTYGTIDRGGVYIGIKEVLSGLETYLPPDNYSSYNPYKECRYLAGEYIGIFKPLIVKNITDNNGIKTPLKISNGPNDTTRELKTDWWLSKPPLSVGEGLDLNLTQSILTGPVDNDTNQIKFYKVGVPKTEDILGNRLNIDVVLNNDESYQYIRFVPRQTMLIPFGGDGTYPLVYNYSQTDIDHGFWGNFYIRNLKAGTGITLDVQQDNSLLITAHFQYPFINLGEGAPVYAGLTHNGYTFYTFYNNDEDTEKGITIDKRFIESPAYTGYVLTANLLYGQVTNLFPYTYLPEPYQVNLVLPMHPGLNNNQTISNLYSENGFHYPQINRIKFIKNETPTHEDWYWTGLQPIMTYLTSDPIKNVRGFSIYETSIDEEDMLIQSDMINLYEGWGMKFSHPYIDDGDYSIQIDTTVQNYPELTIAGSKIRILDDTNPNFDQFLMMRRMYNCKDVTNIAAINYDYLTTLQAPDESHRQILVRGLYCVPQSVFSTTYGLFPMISQPHNNINERFCIRSITFRWGAPWTDVYSTLRGRNEVTRFVDVSNYTNDVSPQREIAMAVPTIRNMKRYFNDIKDKIPEVKQYKASETTHSVFWGTYFTDEEEPAETSTILFREIDIKNVREDQILSINIASNFFDDDTISIDLDPLEIHRLGAQAIPLDMGLNKIINIGTPESNNDAVPKYMYDDLNSNVLGMDVRISALEAIAHEKDHDEGTDPLDENLDLGGDEVTIRKDAIPGQVIPHKVINQADADWNTPTDGVNMRTLKNYIDYQNFETTLNINKHNFASQSDLLLNDSAFGSIYLLSGGVFGYVYMPLITSSNAGQIIHLMIDGGGAEVEVRGYPASGQTINYNGYFDYDKPLYCIRLMSDGDNNWDIISTTFGIGAVHTDGNYEIQPITKKTTVDDGDVFLIENSLNGAFNKKSLEASVLKDYIVPGVKTNWHIATNGTLVLTENDLGTIYLILSDAALDIYLPEITTSNNGKNVIITRVDGTYNINIYPYSGQYLNYDILPFVIDTTFSCATFLSDESLTWNITSLNFDPKALHTNKSGEIYSLPSKFVPSAEDLILIEEYDTYEKKKSTYGEPVRFDLWGQFANHLDYQPILLAGDEFLLESIQGGFVKKYTRLADMTAFISSHIFDNINIPEYNDNQHALKMGANTNSLYRTGDFLKVVH